MWTLDASTRWTEGMINRIKAALDDREFATIREALEANRDNLAEPRYADFIAWWLKFRQGDFDAQKIGARRARANIDAVMVEQGLLPRRIG